MSHRTLPLTIAVMLLAAAPLHADDAEDQAVKAVEQLGGSVTRDDKDPAHPVVSVFLGGAKVTDADLKVLAALKGLKGLSLTNTPVTDASLKELAPLQGLQTLSLFKTKVTDAGLKDLAALKGLKRLYLDSTKVTDAGVAELQKALPDCMITH